MRKTGLCLGVALAAFLLWTLPAAAQRTFKIIVHNNNPTAGLTRAQLARFFLKQAPRWDNGVPVLAVDQSMQSTVRSRFSRDVLGQSIVAIHGYWQHQIFSGRVTPPPVKTSDEDVIAFVRENPGAIGYITDATDLPPEVKVLRIPD